MRISDWSSDVCSSDLKEKGEELIENFTDLDEAYGEYLSSTLMSMEYGPDVLYYLASNPEEAKKIVNSGPQKASIALGRLEARFMDEDKPQQKVRPKVSNAPEPPPTNRGRKDRKSTRLNSSH